MSFVEQHNNVPSDVIDGVGCRNELWCLCLYLNIFSLMCSIWHTYIIHVQFSNIISTHWLCILQMARNLRFGVGYGNENQNPPPPPPPLPTHVELMQSLVDGQCALADAMCQMANREGRNVRQGPKPNQYNNFKDFMDTKPSIFKEAEESLHADEWMNTIEQKFRLLRLTKGMKADYASHQLHGPAGIWWSHHRHTLPAHVEIV
jgi:hypothetical protein